MYNPNPCKLLLLPIKILIRCASAFGLSIIIIFCFSTKFSTGFRFGESVYINTDVKSLIPQQFVAFKGILVFALISLLGLFGILSSIDKQRFQSSAALFLLPCVPTHPCPTTGTDRECI